MREFLKGRWSKPLVFLLCLVPIGVLISQGLRNELGANPIERITHFTGDWTLRFLLITLTITPAR
jgi:sulfoxide reductase heme-binding subunit YedZ